jgi:hypothetical protein
MGKQYAVRGLGLFALAAAGAWIAGACGAGSDANRGNEDDGGGASTGEGAQNAGGGGNGGESFGGSFGVGGSGAECTADMECPPGSICDAGECKPGCNDEQPCQDGFSCCGEACFDLQTDPVHCGSCTNDCTVVDNQETTCELGFCSYGACEPGWYDCDGMPGCEQTSECACSPGSTQNCYPFDPLTLGNGPCTEGTQTCNSGGTGWSLCSGAVGPQPEVCYNGQDEDCNGVDDNSPDVDLDGWTVCDNDCCDEMSAACADPELVNPGAFEFVGNMVDDDCDAATSDAVPAAACSAASDFVAVSGNDVAMAMDLCQFTTAAPPLAQKKWGVISVDQLLANGGAPSGAQLTAMQNSQTAILTNYGTGGVAPLNGPTMAGISTGMMRDANDVGYVIPNDGTTFASNSSPPAAYLAAHGGALPSSLGCSGSCPAGTGANDSVNVRLNIRVPTNAQSFSYRFRFFTAEYWTWSCTIYNDFYLALLTSTAMGLPADKNISFDSLTNPVSVNNGFFDVCQVKGCYSCPLGFGALTGTGMEVDDHYAGSGLQRTGGGTAWLATTAPVTPGETMALELMVFDVSDNFLDTVVLLDQFEWSINPSGVGTDPD